MMVYMEITTWTNKSYHSTLKYYIRMKVLRLAASFNRFMMFSNSPSDTSGSGFIYSSEEIN